MKPRTAVLATILMIGVFGLTPRQSQAAKPVTLAGTWKLKSVNGNDPTTINIRSWQIEFRNPDHWSYAGAMAGAFEGTKVSGSGTWVLRGDQLDYTAGDNKGQTRVHLDGRLLTLSPDPVLRAHGKEPVESQYVNLGGG